MKSWRIFVTLYLLLAVVTVVACHKDSVENKSSNPQSATLGLRASSEVAEGNANIQKAFAIKDQLLTKFGIDLNGAAKARANRNIWKKMSRVRRLEAKAKLARFESLISRVLEIHAENSGDVSLSKHDEIINSLGKAVAYQQSAERFEKKFGENYDPAAAF